MATVTTSSDPDPEPQRWVGPASTVAGVAGISPIGKIIFADTFAVATKDAANESEVVMTATLPIGYYYRPSLLSVTALANGVTAFAGVSDGFEMGMGGVINEAGILVYDFTLVNVNAVGSINIGSDFSSSIKTADDAVALDFQAYFLSRQPLAQILINASEGVTTVVITWMDSSANATAAISVRWRLEVMQFTIEQGISYDVNAPALTYENHF